MLKNTQQELREARERLAYLIKSLAPESEFQKLFTEFPCILSEALPLKLSPNDIIPLGRPGITEPDFVYFADKLLPYPLCGIIEIKRPNTPVVVVPRKNVILLSTDARTAVEQCQKFTPNLHFEMRRRFDCAAFIGNEALNFVIMGLTKDVAKKLTEDWQNKDLMAQIPANCRILTYDTVLDQFSKRVPKRTLLLVPAVFSHKHSDLPSAGKHAPDQSTNQIVIYPRICDYIQRTTGSNVSVVSTGHIKNTATVGISQSNKKNHDYNILVASQFVDSANKKLQYVIGHELAHIIFNHIHKGETLYSLDIDDARHLEIEAEADAFARRLLSIGEARIIKELRELADRGDLIKLTKQRKQDNSSEQELDDDK